MQTSALSVQQLSELESGLKSLVKPGGATPAAAFAPSGIKEEFCTIWPKAVPIIRLVAKYVVYIPGVGSAAGAILTGVADAGDELAKVVCPKPA